MALTSPFAAPTSLADTTEIAPGVHMPWLGFGTWKAHLSALENAIEVALEVGYRLLDTSPIYFNEREVGRAIARAIERGVLTRGELFVTTKLDAPSQGIGSVRPAIERSLKRLKLDYVDLYLVHWPRQALINTLWEQMEEVQRAGLARSIGVSNYRVPHLEQLYRTATIPPAVNQVELNPTYQRRDMQAYCSERGILLEAWAPVIQGGARRVPALVRIGEQHGKTAEQVSLRWILQNGIIAIPKTVHPEWVRENAAVFDFELSAEEMAEIDAVGR